MTGDTAALTNLPASTHQAFDGDVDDAENYTNRSPYPLLHLIREADITRYMKKEEDAEKIFSHNIEKARTLGCPYFEGVLDTLKKDKPAR